MDKVQLEQCIHEYGKDVYTFCSQITGSCQEADDLYQDTFLKATELKEGIDYNQNPRSYLISVALRIWKNRRRKFAWRKRIAGTCALTEETAEADMPGQENSAEDVALQRELEQQVRKAVGELAEKYRIPVYLYIYAPTFCGGNCKCVGNTAGYGEKPASQSARPVEARIGGSF